MQCVMQKIHQARHKLLVLREGEGGGVAMPQLSEVNFGQTPSDLQKPWKQHRIFFMLPKNVIIIIKIPLARFLQ